MIKNGYLEKSGKKLKANFTWISTYVKKKYQIPQGNSVLWFPYTLINQKWSMVQDFIQNYHSVLFSNENLGILYKGSKDRLGDQGRYIFSDIFLYILFTDLMAFTRRYHADIVIRILLTAMSLFTERDILNYMKSVNKQIGGNAPNIITNEDELNRVMIPFSGL
jgi:hypothetical protein